MPPLKALEQASFGGVDSRSNPVVMPTSRFLRMRNWVPRIDGHLELREGYSQIIPAQLPGDGPAYSLTPYTFATPASNPYPLLRPNGTRAVLWWQPTGASSGVAQPFLKYLTGSSALLTTNPGFESGLTGWRGYLSALTGGPPAHTGTQSLEMSGDKRVTVTYPTFTLTPGVAVNLSAWIYIASYAGASPVDVTFVTYDAGHNQVATYPANANTATLGSWQNVTLTHTPASNEIYGSIFLQINSQFTATVQGTVEAFFDDISVLQGSTQYITNGGFESGMAPWLPGGVSFVTAPVHGGSQALQISGSDPNLGVTSTATIVLTPGVPTTLTGWVYVAQYAGTKNIEFAVLTLDANQNPVTYHVATANTAQVGVWQQVQWTFTPLSNEITASAYCLINNENESGTPGLVTAFFDDLSINTAAVLTAPPFQIRGNPIASTARWHYALGKDGYLYMHNGTDAKFFDGVCFRDIGLPILSSAQTASIQVQANLSSPPASAADAVTFTWVASTGSRGPYCDTNGMPTGMPNANMYMAFFDPSTNTLAPCTEPLSGGVLGHPGPPWSTANVPAGYPGGQVNFLMQINGIPTPPAGQKVLLYYPEGARTNGPCLVSQSYGMDGATLSSTTPGVVNVKFPSAHGRATGDIIVLQLHSSTGGAGYTGSVPWSSNGPFSITVVDSLNFTFNTSEASLYAGATPICVIPLVQATTPTYVLNTGNTSGTGPDGWPYRVSLDWETNSSGSYLLPSPLDAATGLTTLLPASTIGGAQPGYQFYACIYNPYTGHVGNRVPIGIRLNNPTDCTVTISGLPDISVPFSARRQELWWTNGADARSWKLLRRKAKPKEGRVIALTSTPGDTEWRILIGRTGDGGEVPYACTDANGNWVFTNAFNESSITVNTGNIDGNSELPTENYMPPFFSCFWREGDRLCGTIQDEPFVYRSASEVDDNTGIFVGDPAQAWSPANIESFPTAENIIGGFGYMQESWVFTRNDVAQLSELSGEVLWNGPYAYGGVAGPFAFDKGWNSLPFWVSHDKQLVTMLPNSNGPMSISTEYEAALLARMGDEFASDGSLLGYMSETEVVYFRDPSRNLEALRIKCVDNTGTPFTIIHDFSLRDEVSPYGQGYEEEYLGILGTDYQHIAIRDGAPHPRVWAGASDGAIYQFYTGGLDQQDPTNPTPTGNAYTADAIMLRYIGGDRTAVKTIEWYGDATIDWYVTDAMDVVPLDPTQWIEVSDQMRPFPADEHGAHYQADLDRPEMIHCYLWAQITAHPIDAPDPLAPMTLNVPPHIPLETYGKLYLTAPILGDTRGR